MLQLKQQGLTDWRYEMIKNKIKKDIKVIIFNSDISSNCIKPTSDDLINVLLPQLQRITGEQNNSYCTKCQKLMEVMIYEPIGENEFCSLRSSYFFSGYFACVPSMQAIREYKEHYKTAKSSYSFLSFCILMLEQRLNQANYFIETKDYNQSDYPLWIWTTYNVLCYHCKVYKDYEMAAIICSLLQDFISGFLSKVCCDII